MYESGCSLTTISQSTGFTYGTVKNYLSANFSPVNAHYGKQRERLLDWMEEASNLNIIELNRFLTGLKNDIDAVFNAVEYPFNNGLAEGTVNKVKVIKRVMYGRCGFELLRSKCLLLQEND